jgi:hypothetical protein
MSIKCEKLQNVVRSIGLRKDVHRRSAQGTTVELHLSGLSGTWSHPDMQKIWISGFFFENSLRGQFEVQLLLFTVCTCV